MGNCPASLDIEFGNDYECSIGCRASCLHLAKFSKIVRGWVGNERRWFGWYGRV